jgi:hypothetical protein
MLSLMTHLQAHDIAAQASLDEAIASCDWPKLNQYIGAMDTAQPVSHRLLHLSVVDDSFQRVCVVVASRYVADEVSQKGSQAHMEHLRSMVDLVIDMPATRAAAGAFFESYAHRLLQRGGEFEVRSLASGTWECRTRRYGMEGER